MTARIGTPKTGGRVKGRSLDKGERQLLTSEMAADLLLVYRKLGGVRWLLKFAQDNPVEFLRQGLSRLFPAAPKDDEVGGTYNTQINFNDMSARDAACRVAFLLNSAMHPDPSLIVEHEPVPVADEPQPMTPQEALDNWRPTPKPSLQPEDNPAQAEWAASLSLTPDQKLVRETVECNIENYHGSSAEQGDTVRSPSSATTRKPTAAELTRRMSRRSELL
jgi:hypothetical protein